MSGWCCFSLLSISLFSSFCWFSDFIPHIFPSFLYFTSFVSPCCCSEGQKMLETASDISKVCMLWRKVSFHSSFRLGSCSSWSLLDRLNSPWLVLWIILSSSSAFQRRTSSVQSTVHEQDFWFSFSHSFPFSCPSNSRTLPTSKSGSYSVANRVHSRVLLAILCELLLALRFLVWSHICYLLSQTCKVSIFFT